MPQNSDLLSINSASKLLGVSKVTLRKWDLEKKLIPVRIGTRGDRRYRREDLEQFLQKNEKWKPIDSTAFQKWFKRGNFWIEETNMHFMLADLPGRQMGQIDQWNKPGFEFCLFTIENNYLHQILSIDDSIACSQAYIDLWHKNPEKIEQLFHEWNVRGNTLEKIMDRLDFIDLKHISNERFLEEFATFTHAVEAYWHISLIVEPYAPYVDQILFPRVEKLISDRKKAREIFSTLCLPPKSSFIAEERKDLLRIATKYLHAPEQRKKLLHEKPEDFLAEIKRNQPDFFDSLQKHQQQFFWIQNSYYDWTTLTLTDFVRFLGDTIKDLNTNQMKEQLHEMENASFIAQKQTQLINEWKIPNKLVHEFEFIQRVTWLKDDRKRVILIMNHYYYRFIQEIARRANTDFRIVGNAFVSEVPQLISQSIPLEKMQKRGQLSVYIVQPGNRYTLLMENEAVAIVDHVIGKKEMHSMQEIHGTVASRGNAPSVHGKIRVILNPKDQTISNEEILVTSMTRPEFLPLMKTAKAFITNEGGITCHAAIVSREMNKPCIIGTLHATKALKDGDEVEMLMNHGVVRLKKRV